MEAGRQEVIHYSTWVKIIKVSEIHCTGNTPTTTETDQTGGEPEKHC